MHGTREMCSICTHDERKHPCRGVAGADRRRDAITNRYGQLGSTRLPSRFRVVCRLIQRDLKTLRLLTPYQGPLVPTVGGVLLFGRERGRHFPDAWLQVGRFAGTGRARILDHRELRGYPVEAIEKAIAFVHEHMGRSTVAVRSAWVPKGRSTWRTSVRRRRSKSPTIAPDACGSLEWVQTQVR
jgi:hypothetical protein